MNILYVVNTFPTLSESFVINELKELENRGHNVSVFALNKSEEKIEHDEIGEMDLSVYYGKKPTVSSFPYLISTRVINRDFLLKVFFIDSPLWHAAWLHLGRQIAEVAEQSEADIIHAHFASPEHASIAYAAAYCDIICTVTAHAYELFASPNIRRLRRVCNLMNHVIVPSKYNKNYLENEVGIKTNVTVIPATTKVDKFQVQSKDEVDGRMLTVGRLVEKKGHIHAINAVAELVEEGYNIDYHIIGKGEKEQLLREFVRERNLEDNVSFLGHVSDERLGQELNEASLFILPCVIASDGDRDAMPVVLKEAMATETACISTTISAIPELITSGHDGILVPPEDNQALSNAIKDLMNDDEKRRKIAKKGRHTVKSQFDIKHSVDLLEDLFIDQVSE